MATKTVFKVFEMRLEFRHILDGGNLQANLYPMDPFSDGEGITFDTYAQAEEQIKNYPPGIYQIQKLYINPPVAVVIDDESEEGYDANFNRS
jgi:hypothetical protein